ncbi:MAG: protein kinase [Gemmatimonadaceae bacterium]|nr:protein kinase [Gemmatimonadaceae bacterium]
MIGTTVGNYRIVEKLGDGGMGAVFRAVDEMLDRDVAIKVLKPELARNAALIERFRLEAVALARLNHPRIATLHGLERHGESLLMIMEYVRGDTLEAIVHRNGRIAWARACELCAAVLDALDHAHDKGVVHRDIKPANVMLANNGAVKVMDFGIARLIGKSRQTQVGHAVGTPMYMAPEQLRGEEVDGRTDLYAVGAVLFELVTGRMAFEADSDYGLMMKQLNDPPPAASSYVTDVPPAVDDIIRRAMAKQRDDRYANATAFRDALLLASGLDVPPSRRTPIPAETRLAVESAAQNAPGALGAPVALGAQGPAGTRVASDAANRAPATRLADDAAPVTGTFHTAESPRQAQLRPWGSLEGWSEGWTRDWRTFAAAAAVLVAAGLGVRILRPDTDVTEMPGTRPDSAQAQVADTTPRTDIAQVVPPPRTEDASSLIINPPAQSGGGGSGGDNGTGGRRAQPPREAVVPPNDRPGGGSGGGSGIERAAPPAGGTSRPVSPTEPVTNDPPPRTDAPRDESPKGEAVESESAANDAIRAAIGSAASLLSGSNSSAASLLDGGTQEQWGALMREGRISMSVSGAPEVRLHGSRATAEFDASVNVRSPFGANRRKSARFTAELQRGGGGWRVVGLRPQGKLELK